MTNKEKFLKGRATANTHKAIACKVYELKIQQNKLSAGQLEFLNRLFLEAKWLYNSIIGSEDIFKYDTKVKEVEVLNRDKVKETRKLLHLSAQSKQEILKRTKTGIKSLSTKKKKGKSNEVGRLKFKSEVNSIPLKQYGNSHKFDFERSTLKLSGCKKHFKLFGMKQLLNTKDISSANLIKNSTGFYIKVVVFEEKQNLKNIKNENKVGIDFGIKDDLTLSNGVKIKTKFPITKQIKRDQKRLSKKVKGSKNQLKQKEKLKKSYIKLTNQKTDLKNKVVSYLKNNYGYIAIQNENIKGWHSGLFSRQIQQSILGGIISELKQLQQTSIVDRYFPSTKLCPECGTLNKTTLKDRIYKCECGYEMDRDVHAAINILFESLNKNNIPMERRDFKPVELNASALEFLDKRVSIDCEAGRYNSIELC